VLLTDRAHQRRVEAAGLHFAELDTLRQKYTALTEGYRQLTPTNITGGGREYANFCWLRWRWLSAELDRKQISNDAMIGTIETDLLVYETVGDRLSEMRVLHPGADGFVLINGAYVVAIRRAFAAFSRFQRWIVRGVDISAIPRDGYALRLASSERGNITLARDALLRFGEVIVPFHGPKRTSHWMDPVRLNNGSSVLVRFNDMNAFNAHRILSRSSHLPEPMRASWHAGFHRSSCIEVNQMFKFEILSWTRSVPFVKEITNGCLGKACFLHMQGPQAKASYFAEAVDRSLTWMPNLSPRILDHRNLSCS